MQALMRLQDWDIETNFARMSQMSTSGLAFGCCSCNLTAKKAEILIADPEEWANVGREFNSDEMMKVLIHEMCHIIFWPLCSDSDNEALEIAVNDVERIISSFVLS